MRYDLELTLEGRVKSDNPSSLDSPFKDQPLRPVSPSVAFDVIYESERINMPVAKTPTSRTSPKPAVKEREALGGPTWVDTKKKAQLPLNMTTTYSYIGGKCW